MSVTAGSTDLYNLCGISVRRQPEVGIKNNVVSVHNAGGGAYFFPGDSAQCGWGHYHFNERVKRLNIYDLKLIQGAAMALAFILVKLFPQIMELSLWWFVAFLIFFLIRPFYMFFVKS